MRFARDMHVCACAWERFGAYERQAGLPPMVLLIVGIIAFQTGTVFMMGSRGH